MKQYVKLFENFVNEEKKKTYFEVKLPNGIYVIGKRSPKKIVGVIIPNKVIKRLNLTEDEINKMQDELRRKDITAAEPYEKKDGRISNVSSLMPITQENFEKYKKVLAKYKIEFDFDFNQSFKDLPVDLGNPGYN